MPSVPPRPTALQLARAAAAVLSLSLTAVLVPGCGHSAPRTTADAAPVAAEVAPAPEAAPAPESAAPAAEAVAATAEPAPAAAEAAAAENAAELHLASQEVIPVVGPIPMQPADGRWLVDEFGQRYFLQRIEKYPGAWIWVEEGKQVKLPRGLQFHVVDHDEATFTIKILGMEPARAGTPRGPTEAELAQVAATYAVDVKEVDRLRFAPAAKGLPTRGQWRQGFTVADMNGDGKLDIVHGPPRKGGTRPLIFLGDGEGGWRHWAEARFPAMPFDYGDVAVADFNRDGHADLAIASHLRGIVVLVSDGQGSFSPWTKGIDFGVGGDTAPSFTSRAIEAVDWNGDGRVDVLAQGEGPRMTRAPIGGRNDVKAGPRGAVVYLNQGDGSWQRKEQVGAGVFGDEVVLGDFNGDGRQDFATASAVKGSKALLNLGKEDGSWEVVAIDALRPSATFRSIAAADFDADGRLDLAVGYVSSELMVQRTGVDLLLAKPDGLWERRPLAVEESNIGIWALGAGDLDGDRAADLVALTGNGSSWILLGDGKGGFAREQSPELGSPEKDCAGYHVKLVDVDGDGRNEVLAGFAGETSTLFAPKLCTSGGALLAWEVAAGGEGAVKTARSPN